MRIRALPRKLSRAPALHFFAIGSLLFLISTLMNNRLDEKKPLVITSSRIDKATRSFEKEIGRPSTSEEQAAILERVIDEEVLFEYALSLGLHRQEASERRLAQIASFVETNEDERSTKELASAAIDLGLHRGDYVLRRLLVDAARRLIGDVTRGMEPSVEAMELYLRQHEDRFRSADRTRISQILLSHSRREDPIADARVLLSSLRGKGPELAGRVGDLDRMPSHLRLITERDLDRRFGKSFAVQIAALPEREWSGPVRSRYGVHLVFVHERKPGEVPTLAQVANKIRAAWREQETQRWIRRRLDALRSTYEVQTDEVIVEDSRLSKATFPHPTKRGRAS